MASGDFFYSRTFRIWRSIFLFRPFYEDRRKACLLPSATELKTNKLSHASQKPQTKRILTSKLRQIFFFLL